MWLGSRDSTRNVTELFPAPLRAPGSLIPPLTDLNDIPGSSCTLLTDGEWKADPRPWTGDGPFTAGTFTFREVRPGAVVEHHGHRAVVLGVEASTATLHHGFLDKHLPVQATWTAPLTELVLQRHRWNILDPVGPMRIIKAGHHGPGGLAGAPILDPRRPGYLRQLETVEI